jgi:hypothetical protein
MTQSGRGCILVLRLSRYVRPGANLGATDDRAVADQHHVAAQDIDFRRRSDSEPFHGRYHAGYSRVNGHGVIRQCATARFGDDAVFIEGSSREPYNRHQ